MTLFGGATAKKSERRKLDRREAYRRAAELAGGEVREGKRASQDRVLFRRGPWRIWLDTYVVSTGQVTVIYTRARAFVTGWRGLRLTVRKKVWLDRVVQGMGFGSPLPVDRRLLDRYVVKGRPEPRVPSLFAARGLGAAILALPSLRLDIKQPSRKARKHLGENAAEVACRTTGIITDVERLVGMVQVVNEALESLERIGEARPAESPEP